MNPDGQEVVVYLLPYAAAGHQQQILGKLMNYLPTHIVLWQEDSVKRVLYIPWSNIAYIDLGDVDLSHMLL